jgi:A1 cistron-splicing factor AAR2
MIKLVLLGAPEGLSITVDFNSWTTGPLFKGLKNIPPGIHYITTNLDQVFGRSGFFVDSTNDLTIWQWSDDSARFQQVTDQDQLSRVKMAMHEIELGLGPYTNDLYESWKMHSNYLSIKLLQKIIPGNLTDLSSTSRLSDVADSRIQKDHTVHFTEIDLKHSFPVGIQGELRSKYSMDKSWLLMKLISESSAEEILGEMQLAFLMFILGQFYDGYEQWKILIHLICNSEESLEKDSGFFLQFICNCLF